MSIASTGHSAGKQHAVGSRWLAKPWQLRRPQRVPVAAGVAAQENEIDFVHVKEADYDARFLRCVELVKEMMGEQG